LLTVAQDGQLRYENEKLLKENNDLHSSLIKIKDENAAQLS